MLKETITYMDYEGNQRTEDFYFNLSKSECLKMEMSTEGGMEKMIRKLIAAQKMPEIIELFEKIISTAYGEKSPDGKRFVKSEELSTAFAQTEAYDQLFVKLATNADEAARFINAIVPNEPILQPSTDNKITPLASHNTNS